MPGMGGFDALAELQRRLPHTPVVMLSGFLDNAVKVKTAAAGAAAALDKSSGLKELPGTVRRIVIPTVSAVEPGAVAADAAPEPPKDESLAAATAELRRLEYAVSHDLGEPLRVMSGFSSLMQDRYAATLDESGQAFLGHIVDAAGRMQSMLDDLLTYSRAGRAEPRAQTVDLAPILRALCEEMHEDLSRQRAGGTVGELPPVVGDPDMVKTILRALVLNAVTFNAAEAPAVHITGHLDGRTAVIAIQDNGIGMDPGHCGRVFDLFQRLHTRGEYPGNGAGLALCRRLITAQGGTITITSTPRNGSCVTLTLPAPDPTQENS